MHTLRWLCLLLTIAAGCGRSGFTLGTGDGDLLCDCINGPCCDGCAFIALADAYVCETPVETTCDANVCGTTVSRRIGQRICQGDTHECTGQVVWGNPQVVETCAADALCDALATPRCQTCDHGCADGACYPECNPATDTCCSSTGVLECWSDTAAGLMWQRDGSAEDQTNDAAEILCMDLDLSGFSDWRLPTVDDLRTLVRGCPDLEAGGACGVISSEGLEQCLEIGCWNDANCRCSAGPGPGLDDAFAPLQLNGPWVDEGCFYWTSSEINSSPAGRHWALHFGAGILGIPLMSPTDAHTRCVRDLP